MLFVDGLGLGHPDPAINPFFRARLPVLTSLYSGALPSLEHATNFSETSTCGFLDANLGVDGLPQSGTGQTALFTGVNGAKIIGKHFGPYPYSTLKPIIAEKNIFRRLLDAGKKPLFANAFPQRYFDYMDKHPVRMSVTSFSCTSCNLPLLRVGDLAAGKGISADITSQGWVHLGHPEIPVISPQEAGRRLVHLTEGNDFVLFEYWHTDRAGHSQKMEDAVYALERLDSFLDGVLGSMNMATTLLLITSDHGNMEDLSTKSHTRNPVPLILRGYKHHDLWKAIQPSSNNIPDLTAVTPSILECMA